VSLLKRHVLVVEIAKIVNGVKIRPKQMQKLSKYNSICEKELPLMVILFVLDKELLTNVL
jgi:hypothetical protein